jgi:hypothetical protein
LASGNAAAQVQGDPADAKRVTIYVSDFELFSSATGRPAPKTNAADGTAQKRNGEPIYQDTEPTTVQARRMMDAFANTLVELLHKNGYPASRSTGNPGTNGVQLRGVFAEADEKNRIRRAILGEGSTNPKFILYVATFNLAHQDQPLYVPAPEQSPDSHYGPVITMNAYVPMVKFEVDKAPVGEDVRKICREIVDQLTTLLVTNPNAVPK